MSPPPRTVSPSQSHRSPGTGGGRSPELLFPPGRAEGCPSACPTASFHAHKHPGSSRSCFLFHSFRQAARISRSELWVGPAPSPREAGRPGTGCSSVPIPGGQRPPVHGRRARLELPRGMSMAPAPSRAGWGSEPGRPPSPPRPRGPLGRAERVSGLPREGAAELKIAAKRGGREGSSEAAAPSPGTSAGPRRLLLGHLPGSPENARSDTQAPARWAPYPSHFYLQASKFLGARGARMGPDRS